MIWLGVLVLYLLPVILLVCVLRWAGLEYRRDRVPILCYHRLIRKADADRGLVRDDEIIYVSYDTVFEQQMAYLHKTGYATLDFDDYVRIRAGEMPRPDKPVMITFDDGYESNYTLAYPVLRRFGQKATIFVAPEPDEESRRLVEGMDGFLTEDQMRELSENGVAIQSHTLTHCILSELDDQTAAHELTESRQRLAQITGRPVNHLAIPRSGYSRRVRRLVAQAGYTTVCGTAKGTAGGASDPFSLPRIVIDRDTTVEDFARGLTPRAALGMRLIGNLKRVPEWLGGARLAEHLRAALYAGPLRPVFETHNLKRLVALAVLLYLSVAILFTWHLVAIL